MIKVLPPSISNLIAAGEVVQRPASVVKELVENSIDALAENITITIADSGRTLIRVTDDGCGMSPEEAKICFERHATSKISSATDLTSIMTYGFRGEALASIAAVSEVRLTTRSKNDETGSRTVFRESVMTSQEEVAAPVGTDIQVCNLFYNVPARRKFLKSDASEWRQILGEFSRVALCRPEVALRLVHNKKEVFNLHSVRNVKQRILDLEGKDLHKELLDVDTTTSIVSVSGFVGRPESARKRSGFQYFFVNGRFFKSPYLHKAVMKAYENLIPEDAAPSYYLFFETDPTTVDINIHPAKTEVKFEAESDVFTIVQAAVREALGNGSFMPSIDFEHNQYPDVSADFPRDRVPQMPKVKIDPSFNPFKTAPREDMDFIDTLPPEPVKGYSKIFEDSYSGSPLLVIAGRYIVTPIRSGMMVVHIRRAKERILYDRYLRSLDEASPISHQAMFPCSIALSPEQNSLLTENANALPALGFCVEFTEEGGLNVLALPEGYCSSEEGAKKAIEDLCAIFAESPSNQMLRAEVRHGIALKMAQSATRNSSYKNLSHTEAQLTIDTLFACPGNEYAPGGGRCFCTINEKDIDSRLL